MITLYQSPTSIARALQIVLEDVGAEYISHRIDFTKSDQRSPEFLQINPKARVPALVTEQGILTETPAILVYLAQLFPQAGLIPLDDPFAFAKVQEFNAYIASTIHVAHAHRGRGYRWVEASDEAALAAMRNFVPTSVAAAFALVETDMLAGPFVMGDTYTICDPYLFTVAQWLELDGIDPASLPRVAAHRAMMLARPAVQRAIEKSLA
jgi:glutathione S-transferase